MFHMMNDYGMNMGISGGLFMTLIWIFVIAMIIYLIKSITTGNSSAGHEENAGEILKRRYAQGELTEEQFKTMRHNLKKLESNA